MKAFVPVFALLAAAAGESDPALLYSGLPLATTYGYGLPLSYAARPVTVTAKTGFAGFDKSGIPALKVARCTNAAGESVACADGFPTDVHNTVAYTHVVAKREAEAEADPALVYAAAPYGYGYAGLPYYGYGVAPYTYPVKVAAPAAIPAVPGGYAAAGRYVAESGGVVHKAKREAEAEAEADPALVYAAAPYGYGYAGLPYYGYGVAPYTYPVKVAAPAAIPAVPGGYAAAGRYVANSGGIVHKAKREAGAEADPALLYAGAYAAPYAYGYAGLPYAYNYNPKVATPYGLTHPSNVGLCLNNVGLRVPC